jgi:SNF2 family DNA or RNA helicase
VITYNFNQTNSLQITGIPAKYPVTNEAPSSLSVPAFLVSSQSFKLIGIHNTEGIIKGSNLIINDLLIEDSLQLQVFCNYDSTNDSSRFRANSSSSRWVQCSISIILYGPEELFDDIGEYLQDHDIYLQRPRFCDRNVPYRNPHKFISEDQPPMTFDVENIKPQVQLENIPNIPDLLDAFTTEEELQETTQPEAIQTHLEKHQKQALTFLLRREKGWIMDYTVPDVWGIEYFSEHFVNRISDCRQVEKPSDFRGGILADPMGMGKTLTIMSLVAKDLETNFQRASSSVQRTLVVVPASLLTTWEEQLEEHVIFSALPWHKHHGKSRLSSDVDLSQPGFILTTYHTVVSEWKSSFSTQRSPLLTKTHWHRIILDESHYIRNHRAQITKAICCLNSTSRWAMTGTPLQNKLSDIATLLAFLRADPYHTSATFETDFVTPWKQGNSQEALERLRRLMKCLLLRRTKSAIQLPNRIDMTCALDFRLNEKQLYDDVLKAVLQQIRDIHIQGSGGNMSFQNTLQRVAALRQVCNLGCFYRQAKDKKLDGSLLLQDARFKAQLSPRYLEDTEVICQLCGINIEDIESELALPIPHVCTSSCQRIICVECSQKFSIPEMEQVMHAPPCQMVISQPDNTEISFRAHSPNLQMPLPTKVDALISQLKEIDDDIKW